MNSATTGRWTPLLACAIVVGLALGALIVLPVSAAPSPSTAAVVPVTAAASALPASLRAFPNGLNASLVLGKLNFTSSPALTNASNLDQSVSSSFDEAGDLWVADSANSRVLEYTPPLTSGQAAHLVLGQGNFSTHNSSTGPAGLQNPSALTFDYRGYLWVADTGNNRVLLYPTPFSTNESAILVLGQPNLTATGVGSGSAQLDGPTAVAFDAAGNLWVSDSGNDRVLEYRSPFATGMAASLVLGEPTFGEPPAGISAASLSAPTGLAFNGSGALFVGDTGNNRVLAFNAPFSTGENASLVLGQPDFTSGLPGVGPAAFDAPGFLSFQSGALWVADAGNNRVLEFAAPVTASSTAALVLGQTSATDGGAGTSATTLSSPEQAIAGPAGSVYVTEFTNSRVVRFSAPIANGSAASLVIGQVNLTTSTTAPTLANLGAAAGIAFGPYGDLWVADTSNNRLLEFPAPFSSGESAAIVIGQTTFNDRNASGGASGLLAPWSIAYAPDGDLWVTDAGHNRVLGYFPPFTTGMAANVVLGQPNFTATSAGTSAQGLSFPTGVATDPAGNVYVADSGNNRVLEFPFPQRLNEIASAVLGQATFTTNSPGTSPQALTDPIGLAVDTNGTLYVADTGNNRVLAFPTPIVTNEAATGVLGQTNFYSAGAGSGPGALNGPTGLAVDLYGLLWVADSGNNRDVRFALPVVDGAPALSVLGQRGFARTSPATTAAGLRGPVGLFVDTTGGLWTTDAGNQRVLLFPGNALAVATDTVTLSASGNGNTSSPDTGVALNITGGPAGASLVVVTQYLSTSAAYGAGPFANQSYFDIAVSPIVAGVVSACFHIVNTTFTGPMAYWNGLTWVTIPTSNIVEGGKACGTFSLSVLTGTNIAVALPTPLAPSTSGNLDVILYGGIGFIVGAVVAVAIYNWRRPPAPPVAAAPDAGAPAAAPPPPLPPSTGS